MPHGGVISYKVFNTVQAGTGCLAGLADCNTTIIKGPFPPLTHPPTGGRMRVPWNSIESMKSKDVVGEGRGEAVEAAPILGNRQTYIL